jgi:hypothetical protein
VGDGGVRAFAVMVASLLCFSCSEKAEVRYKMTFEVNDNGKIYRGSGVWEHKIKSGGFPNEYTSYYDGEAIPIDVGDKGTLFVLTAGRDAPWLPSAFDNAFYGSELFGEKARITRGEKTLDLKPVEQIDEIAGQKGKSALFDCATPPHKYAQCPFMVRFGDINNPQSVVAVDPADISVVFGPGVSLKPIIVTVTDEKVTKGHMMKRLPWLKNYAHKTFDNTDASIRDVSRQELLPLLACGDFSRECYK